MPTTLGNRKHLVFTHVCTFFQHMVWLNNFSFPLAHHMKFIFKFRNYKRKVMFNLRFTTCYRFEVVPMFS